MQSGTEYSAGFFGLTCRAGGARTLPGATENGNRRDEFSADVELICERVPGASDSNQVFLRSRLTTGKNGPRDVLGKGSGRRGAGGFVGCAESCFKSCEVLKRELGLGILRFGGSRPRLCRREGGRLCVKLADASHPFGESRLLIFSTSQPKGCTF